MPTTRSTILHGALALLLTLLGLQLATQWAAAMLQFQPALGPAVITLAGYPLYAPWKLFAWWLAFDAQAPDVFARAGAVAALGGVVSGAVAIGGAARRASHSHATRPTARPAGRTFAMSSRPACSATAASSSVSTMTAICATTAPSMCWPWRRRAPARASAWCCRRC